MTEFERVLKARTQKQIETLPLQIRLWAAEHVPLLEAFLIAVSLHVAALPCMWFIGWALPWPKTPVVTTIVEFDLTDWAKTGMKPKKILEIHEPELNQ